MKKTWFRKFMVKYIIGLNGFTFTFSDKEYTLSWIKGGPYFFLTFVAMGIFCLFVSTEWIRLAVCLPITVLVYILGFWYPSKYPLTEDEANEIEKHNR